MSSVPIDDASNTSGTGYSQVLYFPGRNIPFANTPSMAGVYGANINFFDGHSPWYHGSELSYNGDGNHGVRIWSVDPEK